MTNTAAIVDGAARVLADAIDGHICAAGVTRSVTDVESKVVPLSDDFSAAGLPAVTVAMGAWDPILQPGNERLHMTLLGRVWRPRVDVGQNTVLLYGDRDAIADAWITHSKAYLTENTLQSAVLKGGPGIVPDIHGKPGMERDFLTLPFTIEVVCNRAVSPQPA